MPPDSNEFYSENDFKKLISEYDTLKGKYERLFMHGLRYSFSTEEGREYFLYGFSRRWKILYRNIVNIFSLLPPNADKKPTEDNRIDATINLHAFYINLFGCMDNIAWILALEMDLRDPNGRKLAEVRTKIGLGKKYTELKVGLSDTFKTKLDEFKEWFDLVEEYRHTLAHRVPLYIPPYAVSEVDADEHDRLEVQKQSALENFEPDEWEKLNQQQEDLGRFHPVMSHAHMGAPRSTVVHPQIIANFNTIHELGWLMFDELQNSKK